METNKMYISRTKGKNLSKRIKIIQFRRLTDNTGFPAIKRIHQKMLTLS